MKTILIVKKYSTTIPCAAINSLYFISCTCLKFQYNKDIHNLGDDSPKKYFEGDTGALDKNKIK